MEYRYTADEKEEIQQILNKWISREDKQKQIEVWWRGPIGKAYCDRNIIDPKTRIKGFKLLVGGLPVKSILEVGCSMGHNLTALNLIKGKKYELHGIDPFGYALEKGRENGCSASLVEADAYNIPYQGGYFDLVFTCGVLTHISTRYLQKAINEIYRVCGKYVLIIEYGVMVSTQEMIIKECGIEFICHRDYSNIFPNLRACGAITKREFPDMEPSKLLSWWLFEKT